MAKRIMFAAPTSDSGKTIVTCAFLQAMRNRGLSPAAFKCGPDFIDPMFHREVLGVPSRNLDLFFSEPQDVRSLVSRHSGGSDIAVIEGVMGFYDGIADTDRASSYHLARETKTPSILVVRPRGVSLSLAASLRGILDFRRDHMIRGILLNRCSERHYNLLAPMLEKECGIPVVGYLPEMDAAALSHRHLGLVTAPEIPMLRKKIEAVAHQLEQTADLALILSLSALAEELPAEEEPPPSFHTEVVIAIARDEAFCFYYQDNLDLLESLGARLVPFSPLADAALPKDTCALYLGGGYPELHAGALSANQAMRGNIFSALESGLPTLAEGGGFQYLQEEIVDRAGTSHPMVGAIKATSAQATHGRFGYITLTAQHDNWLCAAGDTIPAHEFHRWDSTATGNSFMAQKPGSGVSWPSIVTKARLFAGYPHLYFPGNPDFARRFVETARLFQKERQAWQNRS